MSQGCLILFFSLSTAVGEGRKCVVRDSNRIIVAGSLVVRCLIRIRVGIVGHQRIDGIERKKDFAHGGISSS